MWKTWLKGLAAAALNGGAGLGIGILGYWANTAATGTVAPLNGKALGIVSGAGAVIGVINYLVKSPLQPAQPTEAPK